MSEHCFDCPIQSQHNLPQVDSISVKAELMHPYNSELSNSFMAKFNINASLKKWRSRIITALIVGLAMPIASPMLSTASIAPRFTSSSSADVAENSVFVLDVNTDTDTTFSIISNSRNSTSFDSQFFTIDSVTGQLAFTSAPSFEVKSDHNSDNIYIVIVRATQISSAATKFETIYATITDVNESPSITSNDGEATAAINVAENATAVTTVSATDDDTAATLTYSIIGGSESATFGINSTTGELTLNPAQDFESLSPGETLEVR
jgi:hypothetical protein